MTINVYREHGYKNREDYLNSLAEEYDFPIDTVNFLADVLGESEDFDGLVTALQDTSDNF